MSQLDIFFRALQEYKKRALNANGRQLKNIIAANPDCERIEVVKTDCKIQADWIEAVEAGLVHIEKAICEERQFIRSDGEVLPIEKIKQVSKESVEHLARHSNLLTRELDGADIIPDKLLTVERLTDYGVYENKFLYMLLCYLRDFVTYRYEKICELTNAYSGSLNIKKQVKSGGRATAVEIKLDERISDDEYVSANNPVRDEIARLDLILKTVAMLLSTPLMEDVSKLPVIKPPITETNVLKMNNNFKGAKELYYFLAAYDKDGFEIEQTTEVISPFKGETAQDFALSVQLLAFLTYGHGLGLYGGLKRRYAEILKEEEKENERKLKEKIKDLKMRIEETGKGAEEYMLLLEQLNRSLEEDALSLIAAKAEIEKRNADIARLNGEIQSLAETVARQIEEKNILQAQHAEETGKLVAECAAQIQYLNARHAEDVANVNSAHAEEIENLNELNGKKIDYLQEQIVYERGRAHDEYTKLLDEKTRADRDIQDLSAQLEEVKEQKLLADASLNAVKKQYGLETGDFTAETDFDELERQYGALKALFKEEWKKTKKKIRREVLKPQNKEKTDGGTDDKE